MARSYTGRDAGRIIEPLLRDAQRRIWVSSPYISPEYAALLVEKHRRGVDVRVVTSDAPSNAEALQVLSQGFIVKKDYLPAIAVFLLVMFSWASFFYYDSRGLEPPLWVLSGFLLSLFLLRLPGLIAGLLGAVLAEVVAGYLGVSDDAAFLAGFGFGVLLFSIVKYARPVLLQGQGVPLLVYPQDRMVHAKIYIIDNTAITGSANLTRSGLWRNMETLTIHEDPEEIRQVEEQFLQVWRA